MVEFVGILFLPLGFGGMEVSRATVLDKIGINQSNKYLKLYCVSKLYISLTILNLNYLKNGPEKLNIVVYRNKYVHFQDVLLNLVADVLRQVSAILGLMPI